MNSTLRSLILSAEFAIIIAVFSQLIIPIGIIPLTGQTFAVGLTATILKKQESLYAVLIYLFLGLIGLPVFAGMSSGIGILLGPTGGFLIGFLLNGWLTGWLLEKTAYNFSWSITANLAGAFATLLAGTVWLKLFSKITWSAAFSGGFLPFILPGIIKALLAAYAGILIRSRLEKFFQRKGNYFFNKFYSILVKKEKEDNL